MTVTAEDVGLVAALDFDLGGEHGELFDEHVDFALRFPPGVGEVDVAFVVFGGHGGDPEVLVVFDGAGVGGFDGESEFDLDGADSGVVEERFLVAVVFDDPDFVAVAGVPFPHDP